MIVTLLPKHQLRNERGLLLYCSQCDKEATAWGEHGTPFCMGCFTLKWYMQRERDEQAQGRRTPVQS
jgi:hypothetical protein